MPDIGNIEPDHVLQLRLPLRPGAQGEVHTVFMPQRPSQMCAGRIVGVPKGSRIDEDGRAATLVASPAEAEVPTLVVEWDLGACHTGYSGFPPFFLESEASAARPLIELMRMSLGW